MSVQKLLHQRHDPLGRVLHDPVPRVVQPLDFGRGKDLLEPLEGSRMPAFGPDKISDTDLAALGEYLASLK